MKAIGGYFEMERPGDGSGFNDTSLALSYGRACINYLLKVLRPSKVYVPYYACNSIIFPLTKNKVKYLFYHLDANLEIANKPKLQNGEYILYVNYFGLKGSYTRALTTFYSGKLIVDNSQAFFEKTNDRIWSFNSARKFFGVPDGAFLNGPNLKISDLDANKLIRLDYLADRASGRVAQGFKKFLEYEKTIGTDIVGISEFSRRVLETVDYKSAAARRRENYAVYAEYFDDRNLLKLRLTSTAVPYCYPFLTKNVVNKEKLISDKIYIPTLWMDVLNRKDDGFRWEKDLSKHLLPLPVDHRYNRADCLRVINKLKLLL